MKRGWSSEALEFFQEKKKQEEMDRSNYNDLTRTHDDHVDVYEMPDSSKSCDEIEEEEYIPSNEIIEL